MLINVIKFTDIKYDASAESVKQTGSWAAVAKVVFLSPYDPSAVD